MTRAGVQLACMDTEPAPEQRMTSSNDGENGGGCAECVLGQASKGLSKELDEAVSGLLAGYDPAQSPALRQSCLRQALRQGRQRLAK